MAQFKTGTFTQAATAVAYEISIGFVPDYFKIWNQTDGIYEEWFKGMTDAHGIIMDGTAVSTAANATITTANGITPSGDAATDDFKGVTYGLHTTINIASKVHFWAAWQE